MAAGRQRSRNLVVLAAAALAASAWAASPEPQPADHPASEHEEKGSFWPLVNVFVRYSDASGKLGLPLQNADFLGVLPGNISTAQVEGDAAVTWQNADSIGYAV